MRTNRGRTGMLSGRSGLYPALLGQSCLQVDFCVGFGFLCSAWFRYAANVHNVTFSVARLTSPHLLMYGEKPDITNHQQFGVEGWIYRREDQRGFIVGKISVRTRNLTPVGSQVSLSIIRRSSQATWYGVLVVPPIPSLL